MPAGNRSKRIGQVVRILIPVTPATVAADLDDPSKIGTIVEVKRQHELPTRYVIKTATGETHELTRDQFATAAVTHSQFLDQPAVLRQHNRLRPEEAAPVARLTPDRPPTQRSKSDRTNQFRPRRHGNSFASVARIKGESK